MGSISLTSVTKTYGRHVTAVADVTLNIADGELLAVVGPSGCGKTTLLRLIAGLETPTAGHILFDGRCVDALSPQRRDVAMVFQDYVLYPHMRVEQNLAFALKMQGVPAGRIKEQIAHTAQLLGIESLLGRKPASLSGGQQQRVALGKAIVRRPAVFLLDEPLSSLDVTFRRQLRAEIRQLHRRLRTTIVYVTHDQAEALSLGDRIAVLREGRIQQLGTAAQLYDRPANRFVAQFISPVGMNFIEARARRESMNVRLTLGTTTIVAPCRPTGVPAGNQEYPVIVGIRPEDVLIEPVSTNRSGTVPALVEMIEPLGSQVRVHVKAVGPTKLVATAPTGMELSVGQDVDVTFESGRIHLFETGPVGRNLDTVGTDGSEK